MATRATTSADEQPSGYAAAGLRSWEWRDRYSTNRDDLVGDFYEPALDRTVSYDRAVGYFRSSLYSLIGPAVARLALRNGRIRLICAPELTADDQDAIRHGLDLRQAVDKAARREIERILQHPLGSEPVEVLANLVALGALDIRFAVQPNKVGIFHDKVGVFHDQLNAVSFSGSINDTWAAWHPFGNHESFEVFRSWQEPDRVSAHQEYFQRLWSGSEAELIIYEAPAAFKEELLRRADDRPERALQNRVARTGPAPRHLFDHQRDALACWQSRDYRGVLKHATGSGKTLTALHAIRDWIAQGKPALVVVPSTLLLEQWEVEATRELSSLKPSVLLAGGAHDEWRRRGLLRLHTGKGSEPRLTIATMQTAATPDFLTGLDETAELLLVADEVHRIASPTHRRILSVDAKGRLGLSATPERSGDPRGTALIFDYFGKLLEPVFTLRDAIGAGRLCPYIYEPSTVTFTPEEEEDWITRTERIRQVYAQEAEGIAQQGEMSEILKNLLIQRARVAKKAVRKTDRACQVVSDNARQGQHWLVYCEDRQQLDDVLGRLRAQGVAALEYHSQMRGDRDATLQLYREQGGVLVSIRCLDEGVDIPEISHALILASSRNPREFVQRRGRVLRTAPGKHQATLWDVLVVPSTVADFDHFDGLVLGEVARAAEFARDALNPGALTYLHQLCIELGIDLALANDGVENDAEEC
jgi:superfamily II DNA or RNA helicase